ncbi:hypothetical protein SMD44_p10018 (plasmid) [Streptomyces alboflavus]|uniref:Uncharacterized protein n=1 Tax=Streptomyces alboflavus TaxID=67267 RepID=A0A291W3L9_9ACTN|nr:hypothetical protein [Streptomyces alboflavus]ATM24517.1 hypothetical protein SMD44_p10018 [Streptomyces alboflavus]
MNHAAAQHAAKIANALADTIRERAAHHPARRALEDIAEQLYTAVTGLVDAVESTPDTPGTGAAPLDVSVPLYDAETMAIRAPEAGLPADFATVVLTPLTGIAPSPPASVSAVSPRLARQDATLRARLALVEEWLLDSQHPDVVPAYVATFLGLRIEIAAIAASIAADNGRTDNQY